MIKILINGAFGKMGSLAASTLQQQLDFDVVARCGKEDDLRAEISRHRPDIVLDLTVATCALNNLAIILEHGVHPVIGTSGLSEVALAPYVQWCQQKQLGAIIAPNFSLSAVMMMRFVSQAASYFTSAEIIEMHHLDKKDAPSGTAIKTAELLTQQGNFIKSDDSGSVRGTRHGAIAIHSVRMNGVLAKQQVLLGNTGETLTIEANTQDRGAYMPGIVLACRKVLQLNELVYGLENLL